MHLRHWVRHDENLILPLSTLSWHVEGWWISLPSCFGCVSISTLRKVGGCQREITMSMPCSFHFPDPEITVLELNSTSGLRNPASPATPQFLSTQSPAISPFSLKIFSVFLLLFCFLQLILVDTRVLYFSSLGLTWKPGKKWERKSQLMSCHQSFIHKCIHYMIHSHKYLSSICYVPGTVVLTNSFDLLRNQGGGGSKRENWEHPLMLNPLAKAVVYQVWKLW